jgi:hypothetical protein
MPDSGRIRGWMQIAILILLLIFALYAACSRRRIVTPGMMIRTFLMSAVKKSVYDGPAASLSQKNVARLIQPH